MKPTNEQLKQLRSGLDEIVASTVAQRHARFRDSGHLSPANASELIADITALTLFELAERLDANVDKPGTLTYRFAAEEELCAPADVLSAITGWLSAPKDQNPIAGKTNHPYPFDFYGEKNYE